VELEVIRNLLYSVIEDMEDRTGTPDDVKKRLIFSALKLEKVRPRTYTSNTDREKGGAIVPRLFDVMPRDVVDDNSTVLTPPSLPPLCCN
jgi:hypothetical protein